MLQESHLCEKYPSDALVYLDAVISDDELLPSRELKQCLDVIANVSPSLAEDSRFVRLSELYQRRRLP